MKFVRDSQGLADLLPYLGFDSTDELLWLKDGSATKTFRVIPRSCLTTTAEELEVLRSQLTHALSALPEGTMVQIWMSRRTAESDGNPALIQWRKNHRDESAAAAFGDSLREKLYLAREAGISRLRELGALYQTEVFVTVRVPPELKSRTAARLGGLAHLIFGRRVKGAAEKPTETMASELTHTVTALQLGLTSAVFEIRPLASEEMVRFLGTFLNPGRKFKDREPEPSESGSERTLSERIALTDLIESRSGLSLGRTQVRIGTMRHFPEATTPALMHLFSSQRRSFDLIQTFLVLPQVAERECLSRKQRLAQGMASGNQVRNLYAESQLQEVEDTLSAMISRGERLIALSLHIITQEDDSESRRLDQLLDEGARLGPGCQWFEETVGAYPVFFGILPFAPTFITRPCRCLMPVAADLLPVYGSGPGHEEASVLFETVDQGLTAFSLFERSASGNAILIGSTGSGKSTLTCGLILGMVAGNSRRAPSSFVIDVGNSFRRTLLYLGGSSLDLSPESGTRINPFDLPVGETFPGPEKVKFLTAFFDEILGDSGMLSKLERALLEAEIFVFYQRESKPTLSRFRAHLAECEHPDLKRLSKLLLLWCQPQPYGLLFDGETNVALSAPHLHFELKGCQRYPDLLRVVMLVVMDLIWREVRTRFPARSLVIIDEAHTLIRPAGDGRANGTARWVEDGFRQMRKFSSAAIAISQTAKDLKSPEIGDGILANAPNRFILRQRGDEATLRGDLKLNDRELAEVFALAQVRGEFSEFFLHSESIRGTFRYRPTSLELWLSTTHPPDLALLQETQNQHPDWTLSQLMDHLASEYPTGSERRAV